MPKEYDHKDHDSQQMSCLEELIVAIPAPCQRLPNPNIVSRIPDHAVGAESEPCLENKRDNASPIIKSAHHRHFHDHIVPSDVVDNEWECMHEGEKEEHVRDPAMQHLELFVGDSCEERDPIGLTCSRTALH